MSDNGTTIIGMTGCGGGACLGAVVGWKEARIKAGRPKADQIQKTGAKWS